MTPISVGLVGAGAIAERHLQAYQSHAALGRVTAVADVNPHRARVLASRAGGEAFTDLDSLLSHADVAVVDICLPHYLHADAICAAVRLGKHVVVEKPLCTNEKDVERILRTIKDGTSVLRVMHNRLHVPTVCRARQLIDQGLIGRVLQLRVVDCFRSPISAQTAGWRASRELAGGGQLLDTGYHSVYTALHLANARAISVNAQLSLLRLDFLEAEDSAELLLTFADGSVGTISTSWAFDGPGGSEYFEVIGTDGWLRGTRTTLESFGGEDQARQLELYDRTNGMLELLEEFLLACALADAKLERPNEVHAIQPAVDVLDVLWAAYRSSHLGEVQNIASRPLE